MNLSFAGCGFMGIYHVGVAACFRKYAPDLYLNRVSGASAGAIAAACLLCDAPLGEITRNILELAMTARGRCLGPFSPSFNITQHLQQGLEKTLPDDAHLLVNGKLHVSVTRVYDGSNIVLRQFDTKEELIQALLCSSFIPFFSGILPPRFRGVRYMDGGLSDNLLVLDEHTVTVSPFCGESDICPRDSDTPKLIHVVLANTSIELSRRNLDRMFNIMFPPKVETLSKICQQGFDDARRFLQLHNMDSCCRCLATSVSRRKSAAHFPKRSRAVTMSSETDCHDCLAQRKIVLKDRLPETVSMTLQNAMEATNSGLMNWIFQNRGLRLLALPYILPVDVAYATYLKFIDSAPKVSSQLRGAANAVATCMAEAVVEVLKYTLNTQVTCQLAFTEYSGVAKVNSIGNGDSLDESRKNSVNFEFSINLDSSRENYTIQPGSLTSTAFSDDSLEEILALTARHDALMNYYFLDSKNQVHVHQVFDGNGSSPTPSFGRRLSLFDEPASGCRTPQPSYDTNCALNLIT